MRLRHFDAGPVDRLAIDGVSYELDGQVLV
jgi:hypothetical protein